MDGILDKVKEAMIYLDYAAATPLDERALAAMQPYFSDAFFNPSSPYAQAIETRRAYEDAKHTIARAIGAKGDELIMTAGATESINLAFGVVGDGHVVSSAIEHQAVLEATKRYNHTLVPATKKGRVTVESIEQAIREDTRLVSIALANNEIGTVQPLHDIAVVIRRERERRRSIGSTTPIYLHSDASQGLGLLDVHVARLGVDLLTLNAAKVYGPKQVGLLWATRSVQLTPQIVGGGQERGLRSGTENVPGVIGFAAALERADKIRKQELVRLAELRDTLRNRLVEAFPEAVISGDQKHQLPNFLHISFPGIDAERIIFMLEAQNILVATGSACAANKGTRSHVLEAIGLSPQVADGSIRMTLGRGTTHEAIDTAADALIKAVKQEYMRTRT